MGPGPCCARPTTISPQGAQLNLAPGQTFAKNQFVSGIEVTTILDRNCGNQSIRRPLETMSEE
jgi:hypothetical protein